MEQIKKAFFWQPRKLPKRRPDGTEIAGDYVGKFVTRVPEGAPGAIRFTGRNEDLNREWDYWGLPVDSINGKLVWIDKVYNDKFKRASLVLWLESPQFLHKIEVEYACIELRNVMNHLCGLGLNVHEQVLNVSYWVRKQLDKDKRQKISDNGQPIWAYSLSFRDIDPQFSYDEWLTFSQQNGLDWEKRARPDGTEYWDNFKELAYWDSRLVGIQRFLLKQGVARPFSWGSVIVSEKPNPSGGGNLTSAEIAECSRLYEQYRYAYEFPFSRKETSADDGITAAFSAPVQMPATATPGPALASQAVASPVDVMFPESDLTDYEDGTPDPADDLPFKKQNL